MVDHLHVFEVVPFAHMVRDCNMSGGSPTEPAAKKGQSKLCPRAHLSSICPEAAAALPVFLVSERFRANAPSNLVQQQAIRANCLIAMMLDHKRLSGEGGECHRS